MCTKQQKEWTYRHRRYTSEISLLNLIRKQKGKCKLSEVEMTFDKRKGTPCKGRGCHPLYASVDHCAPGQNGEYQIVCCALNDLKGHLPKDCFIALSNTPPWKSLMNKWKKQAEKNKNDRKAFGNLLRPDANR